MSAAIDHVIVFCSVGAPEADALLRAGLKEGTPNTHPGQGTACRRFFFSNAYLELVWVRDPREAQSELAANTRLWERWSRRGLGASPFGIVLRPAGQAAHPEPPFDAWSYRPSYLPPGMSIEIARDTPLTEPEFFFLAFQRDRPRLGMEPVDHSLKVGDVTGVEVWTPAAAVSAAATALQAAGLVSFAVAGESLMELTFDGGSQGQTVDLRPDLPLTFRL